VKLPGKHPDDRELASLSVPAFFTYLAAPIYQLTDTAIVGRLGVAQLAGLAVAAAAYTTAYFIFNGLTTGLAGSIARRRGANDHRAAFEMWVAGAWTTTAISLTCAVVLAVFAVPMLRALGASGAVLGYGVTYLRISVIGLPPLMLAAACTHYLRAGRGDARTPLVITITASALNLVLEMLFVWVFRWGVAGSAWSTVIVEWLAFGVFATFVFLRARGLQATGVPRRADLRETLDIGGWMVLRTAALTAALTMLTATAARISPEALAANQIAYQVWLALAFAVSGIEVANNALVGKHLGAQTPDIARRVARRSLEYGIGIGLVSAAVVIAARYPLAAIFTNDAAVRELAAQALLIVAVMQPIAAVAFTLDGLFVGSGDVRFLALLMVSAFVLVFLPWSLLVLANGWSLNALWLVVGGWIAFRAAAGTIRYRSGRWVTARVIPPQPVL
jgi:putative MATE family efflux protein